MILFSPAKINFGLKVIARRSDGYHDLSSFLIPIPLFDVLEIMPIKEDFGGRVKLYHYGIKPTCPDEENLIVKAFQLLHSRHKLPDVTIFILKNIPVGAGLGGGSSNAASILLAANQLFNLNYTYSDLAELALQVGSDCPFFIYQQPALIAGRGEILTPVDPFLKDYFVKVFFPDISINTTDAFARQEFSTSSPFLIEDLVTLERSSAGFSLFTNDFEQSVLVQSELLRSLKSYLVELNALYISVSGTGSAMYALFEKPVALSSFWRKYLIWEGRL